MHMAIGFAGTPRLRVLAAFVAVAFAFQAHAQDARPAAQPPAAASDKAPSGQKGGGGRDGGQAPFAAEQHRLPPDQTTQQTLALPERMLSFAATAGSIRLFDDKGEAQADIAYTSYQLDGA